MKWGSTSRRVWVISAETRGCRGGWARTAGERGAAAQFEPATASAVGMKDDDPFEAVPAAARRPRGSGMERPAHPHWACSQSSAAPGSRSVRFYYIRRRGPERVERPEHAQPAGGNPAAHPQRQRRCAAGGAAERQAGRAERGAPGHGTRGDPHPGAACGSAGRGRGAPGARHHRVVRAGRRRSGCGPSQLCGVLGRSVVPKDASARVGAGPPGISCCDDTPSRRPTPDAPRQCSPVAPSVSSSIFHLGQALRSSSLAEVCGVLDQVTMLSSLLPVLRVSLPASSFPQTGEGRRFLRQKPHESLGGFEIRPPAFSAGSWSRLTARQGLCTAASHSRRAAAVNGLRPSRATLSPVDTSGRKYLISFGAAEPSSVSCRRSDVSGTSPCRRRPARWMSARREVARRNASSRSAGSDQLFGPHGSFEGRLPPGLRRNQSFSMPCPRCCRRLAVNSSHRGRRPGAATPRTASPRGRCSVDVAVAHRIETASIRFRSRVIRVSHAGSSRRFPLVSSDVGLSGGSGARASIPDAGLAATHLRASSVAACCVHFPPVSAPGVLFRRTRLVGMQLW